MRISHTHKMQFDTHMVVGGLESQKLWLNINNLNRNLSVLAIDIDTLEILMEHQLFQ